MKIITGLLILMLFCTGAVIAQQVPGYNKNYHFIHSANLVADKDFYLLTVIGQTPGISGILKNDKILNGVLEKRTGILKRHVTDTCKMPASLVTDFKWNKNDSLEVANELKRLYTTHRQAFDRIVDLHLRPSGYYQRFSKLTDSALLMCVW
jgi:hypothetical protein